MSNCEGIAQVGHDKWAKVSDLLRSLRTNERMSVSLVFFERIAHFLVRSQKMSDSLKQIFVCFYQFFLKFLKKKKNCLFFLSEVSELLRPIRTIERLWAIRSVAQKEWSNSMSEFPTLVKDW